MALTDNLVAFWELEEASGSRADATGRGNTLTDVNSNVGQGTGKVGSDATFVAASSTHLRSLSNSDLAMSSDFTIAAWVKYSSGGNWGVVTKDNEYEFDTNGGDVRFTVFDSVSGSATTGPIAGANDGAWHFIVCTYQSADKTPRIYIDNGSENVNQVLANGLITGSTAFNIGAYESGFGFTGDIDQVGLWKRAITSDERTQLYNSGSGVSYAAMSGGGATPPPAMRFMRGKRPSKLRRAS